MAGHGLDGTLKRLASYLQRDQAFDLLDLPEEERHAWVAERVRRGEIELIPEPAPDDPRFCSTRL